MTAKTATGKKRSEKKEAQKTLKPRVDGVEYHRIRKAICPACNMAPGYVTKTLPWEDDTRVRYHTCRRCGTRFKSIETD